MRKRFVCTDLHSLLGFSMQGQVSIETLLLLAVGIAALSIIFGAGERVLALQQRQYENFAAHDAAVKIANAVDDVCAFGPGNVRIVDAGIGEFGIRENEDGISLAYANALAHEETRCSAHVEGAAFGKKVRVEYGGYENDAAFAKISAVAQ